MQLAQRVMQQLAESHQLARCTDHWHKNAQRPHARIRAQHGAQLRHQQWRVVETETNAAPAERGVFLADGEVGQSLVAADIQHPQVDRLAPVRLQHMAINIELFFLGGETIAHHKRDLGAIQPDALGPCIQARRQVGQQAAVDEQCHPFAIGRDGRFVAQVLQASPQGLLRGGQTPVL